MYYVVLDIGCLECNNPTDVVGIFTSRDDAVEAADWYSGVYSPNPDTSREVRIFKVPELDKWCGPQWRGYSLFYEIEDGYEYKLDKK